MIANGTYVTFNSSHYTYSGVIVAYIPAGSTLSEVYSGYHQARNRFVGSPKMVTDHSRYIIEVQDFDTQKLPRYHVKKASSLE